MRGEAKEGKELVRSSPYVSDLTGRKNRLPRSQCAHSVLAGVGSSDPILFPCVRLVVWIYFTRGGSSFNKSDLRVERASDTIGFVIWSLFVCVIFYDDRRHSIIDRGVDPG